jgi:hypothetical protein
MIVVLNSISAPTTKYRRPPMFQGYRIGKGVVVLMLAFPGLESLPGYALFGAYAVKWIGLFKITDI